MILCILNWQDNKCCWLRLTAGVIWYKLPLPPEWVANTGPSCVAKHWYQKITSTLMMRLTLVVIILKIRLGFLDRLSCHRAIQSKGSSLPTATPPCTGLRQLASSLPTLTNLHNLGGEPLKIDLMYLDTTFCSKDYEKFPPRRHADEGIWELVNSWIRKNGMIFPLKYFVRIQILNWL